MPKAKTDRQKINEAREKYARQYAQKLAGRDARIRELNEANTALASEMKDMQKALDSEKEKTAMLEKSLQDALGMTPEQKAAFLEHLERTKDVKKALDGLLSLGSLMGGAYMG